MYLTILFQFVCAGTLGAFFAFERDLSGSKNDWLAHAIAGILACGVGLSLFTVRTNYLDYLILSIGGAAIAAMVLRAVLMFVLAWWRRSSDRPVDVFTLAFAFLIGASCAAGDAKLVIVVMLLMAGVSVFRGGAAFASIAAGVRPASLGFVLEARASVVKRMRIAAPYLFGFGPLARAAHDCDTLSAVPDPTAPVVMRAEGKSTPVPIGADDLTIASHLRSIATVLRNEWGSARAVQRLNDLNSGFLDRRATRPRTPISDASLTDISVEIASAKPGASRSRARLPSHNVAARQSFPERRRFEIARLRHKFVQRRNDLAAN